MNLDRFSRPLSWELELEGPSLIEVEYQEPILCACGCGREIVLEDEATYIESEIWEDQYIVNEPIHLNSYYSRENDQLVGSQSSN